MKKISATVLMFVLSACGTQSGSQSSVKSENEPTIRDAMLNLITSIDAANQQDYEVSENFSMDHLKLDQAMTSPKLTSTDDVKKALAECVFNDKSNSEWSARYAAAQDVWKKIRDRVRTGEMNLYRVESGTSVPTGQIVETFRESCGVAGASCAVYFQVSQDHPLSMLTVGGDSCQ